MTPVIVDVTAAVSARAHVRRAWWASVIAAAFLLYAGVVIPVVSWGSSRVTTITAITAAVLLVLAWGLVRHHRLAAWLLAAVVLGDALLVVGPDLLDGDVGKVVFVLVVRLSVAYFILRGSGSCSAVSWPCPDQVRRASPDAGGAAPGAWDPTPFEVCCCS